MLCRTRNRSNQATAAKPTTKAITVATSSCGPVALIPSRPGGRRRAARTGRRRTPPGWPAGTRTGRPARGSSPRNRPALMVAPDRDTPGTSARHWARPTTTASRQVSCSTSRFCRPTYSASGDHRGEHHQRRRDHPQVAHAGADLVLEQQAEHADRDGADDDVPAQPVVGVAVRGDPNRPLNHALRMRTMSRAK